jgi:CTP:molybdopterin cytidylyltransferase MocA
MTLEPRTTPAERALGPRAALVLAGGASSRMGRWKGGLDWRGKPLVLAHARVLAAAGAVAVKTVYPEPVRHEAEPLLSPTARVMNPDSDAPMFASIQLGLRTLLSDRSDWGSVLITPVDAVPLDEERLAALWHRHESLDVWVTRPRARSDGDGRNRHGHPIVVDQRLFESILAASPDDARLDVLVGQLPASAIAEFELDSRETLFNINTPRDYDMAGRGEAEGMHD